MRLKKLFLSLFSAATLVGCSTPHFIASPFTSKHDERLRFFKNYEELNLAIKYVREGQVTEGEWKGIKPRLVERKVESLSEFVEPSHDYVLEYLSQIRLKFPKFDNWGPHEKANIIYLMIGKNFTYKMNPFDKLGYVDESLLPKDVKILKDNYLLGCQTITETVLHKKGDCEDLSNLLTSTLIAAGVNAQPVYLAYFENMAHLMTSYTVGNEKFCLEATLWPNTNFSVSRNVANKEISNKEKVKEIKFLDPVLKK